MIVVPRTLFASLLAVAGILATVFASYTGLVYLPDAQVSALEPLEQPSESELAARGREVYISLGCIYCHSQQVRQNDFGGDISRGWGARASVPVDYQGEAPPLLGTMRTGPDLRNIGVRQPSKDWHYLHLYNPRIVSKGSIMPPYRFLFEERPKAGKLGPPVDALDLPAGYGPSDAWVVAGPDGEALVSYLLSLRHDDPLPEGASSPPPRVKEEPES